MTQVRLFTRVNPTMPVQRLFLGERPPAFTLVAIWVHVYYPVNPQGVSALEGFPADVTHVVALHQVDPHVAPEGRPVRERISADLTFPWPLPSVHHAVFYQGCFAFERPITLFTLVYDFLADSMFSSLVNG